MGIKTEDFVRNIPPKEVTGDIDWIGILDAFDPTSLEQRYVNECARRNPYDTCYRWDTPSRPIEERLRHSEWALDRYRQELQSCVRRIESEGLSSQTYKLARGALIKAIGEKGAAEYNRREYERLGEDGRQRQAEEYKQWEADCAAELEREEQEAIDSDTYDYYDPAPVSVHEKVVRIRKGLKASNGRPLTQRDFAKYIGYPINKYIEAEKIDRWPNRGNRDESEVDYELLEKLVMICHANPYWLFDPDCEACYAEDNLNAVIVLLGDEPCVYAPVDVILRWIIEGKPRITCWEDGRV